MIRHLQRILSISNFKLTILLVVGVLLTTLLLGLLPISFMIFIYRLLGWNLEEVKMASEILNQIYVGLGALFAGASLLRIALKFYKDYQLKKKITYYKQLYPITNYPTQFDFVKNGRSAIYLRDLNNKILYHLSNPQTVEDLGFFGLIFDSGVSSSKVKIIFDNEFVKYELGEPIDTTKF